MAIDLSNLRREISEIGADVSAIGDRLRSGDPADQAAIDELANQLDAHGKKLEALLAPVEPAPADPVPPADPNAAA